MPVAPEILHSTLEYYGHGRALWCPEPPIDDGEAHEVQIGDVGFFDEDGGFKRLFNVMKDENHVLNKGGVPKNFVPLQISKRLHSDRKGQFPPTAFHSRTVKSESTEGHIEASAGGYAGASLGLSFRFSSAVGGLLILRDEADKTVVMPGHTINQYIRQNHDSWHAFATGDSYGVDIKPEDIIMVRGFVKTSAWAVAAFPDGGSSQQEFSFSAKAGSIADAGFHFSKDHSRHIAFEHRIGPTGTVSRTPSRASVKAGKARATTSHDRLSIADDAEGSDGSRRDQTAFVGYFKMKKRFWGRRIKAAAGYDTLPGQDEDEGEESAVEAHPLHEQARTALDDVLDYILARSDAECAIVSDGDISDLFGEAPWPEDMNDWLYGHLPTIDVDDDKVGTLSILDSIRRAHAVIAQEQEVAAGIAWEARQAELMERHEREEAERAIREVQQREDAEREAQAKMEQQQNAEFQQGSSGGQDETAPAAEQGAPPADPRATAPPAEQDAPSTEAQISAPPAEQGAQPTEHQSATPATEQDAQAPEPQDAATAVDEDVIMEESGQVAGTTEDTPETSEQTTKDPPPDDAPERPSGDSGNSDQPSFSEPGPSELRSSYIPEFLEERVSGTCVTTDGQVIVGTKTSSTRSSSFPHTLLTDKSAEGGGVSSISISKTGRLIATGCEDCYVRVWDLVIGSLICKLDRHADTVWTVCFSPDESRLVSGSADRKAIIWDLHTREFMREMEGHEADVWLSDFSPDSQLIATGSVDCTVRIWDRDGFPVHTLQNHNAVIMGVKFSPDGSRLATYADNMCYLWNPADGTKVATLQGHGSVIWSLAFSKDSGRVVTAAEDSSCRVWDAESGDELVTINEHTGPVWHAVFSPDGAHVASGSYDQLVLICDSFTAEKYHTLERDSNSIVNVVGYSAAGDLLAAGHADGNVRVYDPNTGHFVAEFRGHEDKVKTVEFMPDDNRLVSTSDDGTVRIWNMLEALRL